VSPLPHQFFQNGQQFFVFKKVLAEDFTPIFFSEERIQDEVSEQAFGALRAPAVFGACPYFHAGVATGKKGEIFTILAEHFGNLQFRVFSQIAGVVYAFHQIFLAVTSEHLFEF